MSKFKKGDLLTPKKGSKTSMGLKLENIKIVEVINNQYGYLEVKIIDLHDPTRKVAPTLDAKWVVYGSKINSDQVFNEYNVCSEYEVGDVIRLYTNSMKEYKETEQLTKNVGANSDLTLILALS